MTPFTPDKNEGVTFIPEGSALLDCSETLKHLCRALAQPVKEVWTALSIFPAWIQVLGHPPVSDTWSQSCSDHTLTRSPASTFLALTLSVPDCRLSASIGLAPP